MHIKRETCVLRRSRFISNVSKLCRRLGKKSKVNRRGFFGIREFSSTGWARISLRLQVTTEAKVAENFEPLFFHVLLYSGFKKNNGSAIAGRTTQVCESVHCYRKVCAEIITSLFPGKLTERELRDGVPERRQTWSFVLDPRDNGLVTRTFTTLSVCPLGL